MSNVSNSSATTEKANVQDAGGNSNSQSKSTPHSVPFDPVNLQIAVQNDPEKLLFGRFKAVINQEGLTLIPFMGDPYLIKSGTEVKYLGDNRISINLPLPHKPEVSRTVHFKVERFFSKQNLLALDVVAFLNGDLHRLQVSDYRIPFYLFLPALLPLGIIALVYFYGGFKDTFLMWGSIGTAIVLSVFLFFVLMHEKTKLLVRMLASVLFSGLGYLAFAYFLGLITFGSNEDEKNEQSKIGWHQVAYRDYQCRLEWPVDPVAKPDTTIELPGNEKLTLHHFFADYTSHNVVYQFSVGELSDSARENFLKHKDLLQKLLKDEFPDGEITEYYDDIGHMANRNDDDTWNMGVEIQMKLPGNRFVLRRIFVMRKRVYMLTMVRDLNETKRYLEEQFFYNLIHTGMKPLIDPPNLAGGGGGGNLGNNAGGGNGIRGPIGPVPRNLPETIRKNFPTAPQPTRTRPTRAGGRGRGPGLSPPGPRSSASELSSDASKPESTVQSSTATKPTVPTSSAPAPRSESGTKPTAPAPSKPG